MRYTGGSLELSGAARDLVTLADRTRCIGEAHVRATVDDERRVVDLETEPGVREVEALLGTQVRGGFRAAVGRAVPSEVAAGTLLALLLDDLPVATLISGYALLYSGDLPAGSLEQTPQADVCSGWRTSGTMMASVRAGRGVPLTVGPVAPRFEEDVEGDPLGWHPLPALPVGAMRRRRRIDVGVDGSWEVDAMFRDTHVDRQGGETVLHEYALSATVDPHDRTFSTCAAVPRVLPWVECPVAAASAERLVGHEVSSIREFVRTDLRGTSTCTHLNDLLRSLGDVDRLAAMLTGTESKRGELTAACDRAPGSNRTLGSM